MIQTIRTYTIRTYYILATIVSIVAIAGCSITHKATQSQRTTVEQLLISEAVQRSLPEDIDKLLPIPRGTAVTLQTSVISVPTEVSTEKFLVQQVIEGWLGQNGYAIQKDEKNATHRVSVIVSALGTELGGNFFGMPPVTSQLIPFSLPELALYKAQYQTGYVKLYMNFFELSSGRFVGSIAPLAGETYYNDHTVLLFLSFISTDLEAPPQLGVLRTPIYKRIWDDKAKKGRNK
jgi:hypothetical protein